MTETEIYILIIALVIYAVLMFIAFALGQSHMRRKNEDKFIADIKRETRAMKIDCLQNERNRLTYLLSESKRGRMVRKIQNELTNVTNQLLKIEGAETSGFYSDGDGGGGKFIVKDCTFTSTGDGVKIGETQ